MALVVPSHSKTVQWWSHEGDWRSGPRTFRYDEARDSYNKNEKGPGISWPHDHQNTRFPWVSQIKEVVMYAAITLGDAFCDMFRSVVEETVAANKSGFCSHMFTELQLVNILKTKMMLRNVIQIPVIDRFTILKIPLLRGEEGPW